MLTTTLVPLAAILLVLASVAVHTVPYPTTTSPAYIFSGVAARAFVWGTAPLMGRAFAPTWMATKAYPIGRALRQVPVHPTGWPVLWG